LSQFLVVMAGQVLAMTESLAENSLPPAALLGCFASLAMTGLGRGREKASICSTFARSCKQIDANAQRPFQHLSRAM